MNKPVVAGINLRSFADVPILEQIEQYIPEIQSTIDKVKEVQKAKAFFTEISELSYSGIEAFGILNTLLQQMKEFIQNIIETSFYWLEIEPLRGGFYSYINELQANLLNKSDPQAPIDEGADVMMLMMGLLVYKDVQEAQRNFENLKNMFSNFDKLRNQLTLKYALDYDSLKEEIYEFYRERKLKGSHYITKEKWEKKSLADFFPPQITDLFNSLDKIHYTTTSPSVVLSMSGRVDNALQDLLDLLETVIAIISAYKKLVLDSGLFVILTPPQESIAAEQSSYVIPANEVLASYLWQIPDKIKTGDYEKLTSHEVDDTFLLESSYFVGGINFVFKAPDTTTILQYSDRLRSILGF